MLHEADQSGTSNGLLRSREYPCGPSLEQRSHSRYVSTLRVALLHVEGCKELCVVRNISSGGLSVRVYRELAPGQQIEVELRSGELLRGSVAWERDWEVGIVFPELVDVTSFLATQWVTEGGKGRSLPRIDVAIRGWLKMGGQSYNVLLQDISQGGAKVQVQTPIVEGSHVFLGLPELAPAAGTVRWMRDTVVGISFNDCLPFDVLARWIQKRRASHNVSIETV